MAINWFQVLKINDATGKPLRMTDYDRFVPLLRATLRNKVLQHNPVKTGSAKWKEISRININRTRGVTVGDILTFSISGLNVGGERFRYNFTLKEDETGDYVYQTIQGPGINYQMDTVINDEQTIIDNIANIIGTHHQSAPRPKTDARDIQEEMIAEHDDHKLYLDDFSKYEQDKVNYANQLREEGQANWKSYLPNYDLPIHERYNNWLRNIGRSDLVRDEESN